MPPAPEREADASSWSGDGPGASGLPGWRWFLSPPRSGLHRPAWWGGPVSCGVLSSTLIPACQGPVGLPPPPPVVTTKTVPRPGPRPRGTVAGRNPGLQAAAAEAKPGGPAPPSAGAALTPRLILHVGGRPGTTLSQAQGTPGAGGPTSRAGGSLCGCSPGSSASSRARGVQA